jgi:polyisoprenoid-binding protein YceI
LDSTTLPAGLWEVDRAHSSIGFAVGYLAGTFCGTFGDFDADLNPEISFASEAITREGDAVAIEGAITIKGQTEPVEVTVTAELQLLRVAPGGASPAPARRTT